MHIIHYLSLSRSLALALPILALSLSILSLSLSILALSLSLSIKSDAINPLAPAR